MKKRLLRGIVVAAMTGMVLAAYAQDTNLDQSQYPTILQQPVDQCLPIGSPVIFSVLATNVETYQWYKNNVAMDGQTNSSITIANTVINDVGYYSASVIKGADAVPTRSASLNVYTTATSTLTSTTSLKLKVSKLTLSGGLMSTLDFGGGGSVTIYGAPVISSGGSGNCPGRYSGYVNFMKTASQGWGWAPTAGVPHTATDNNRTDTKVQFMGQYGDSGCAQTAVTVANPMSPVYRFSIYFSTNTVVPTNAYPITLDGFDP
jgi:hypothetical protein